MWNFFRFGGSISYPWRCRWCSGKILSLKRNIVDMKRIHHYLMISTSSQCNGNCFQDYLSLRCMWSCVQIVFSRPCNIQVHPKVPQAIDWHLSWWLAILFYPQNIFQPVIALIFSVLSLWKEASACTFLWIVYLYKRHLFLTLIYLSLKSEQ